MTYIEGTAAPYGVWVYSGGGSDQAQAQEGSRPASSRTHGADPEMDIWEIGMMMAMTFMTSLPQDAIAFTERHSFTSQLANAGVPPEVRQQLTGHSDLSSHRIYTHLEVDTLGKAIAALPALP